MLIRVIELYAQARTSVTLKLKIMQNGCTFVPLICLWQPGFSVNINCFFFVPDYGRYYLCSLAVNKKPVDREKCGFSIGFDIVNDSTRVNDLR